MLNEPHSAPDEGACFLQPCPADALALIESIERIAADHPESGAALSLPALRRRYGLELEIARRRRSN